jgi:ABC-type Fe3+/spermidine/putrescine transport system ATPase subunit
MEVVFKNVEKRYGDFYAVRDLNLTIRSGALHFLLGPSGCGKTTTLRMLAGLETVSGGKILFDGTDVTNKQASERGVGMVFQNYALWPHMTVRKNIEYGLKLRKLSKAEIDERVDTVLSITQLHKFVERFPGQLSGGQQQRVALARALAIRPNVLLLDEPLSNLDAKLRLEMRENIISIHEKTGITTVYVTHDQKEALSMGTNISVMRAGELIQTEQPKRLYRFPKTPFIANFIGNTNLVEGVYKENKNGLHTVETAFGDIKARQSMVEAAVGSKVMVAFRPESIVLSTNKRDVAQSNEFNASWHASTFLGESEQIHVNVGEIPVRVNSYEFADYEIKRGDQVFCTLPHDEVLVLPHDTNIGSHT